MKKIIKWIKRGIKYILHGQPIVINKVVPEIVSLSNSEILKEKTALITGGTSGIGTAIAEAFVKAGAKVIITSRNEQRAIQTAKRLSEQANGIVLGIALDNADIKTMPDKFNDLLNLLGNNQIDILVNNAGIGMGMVKGTEEDEYDGIMDTNLKGTYFLSKLVAKYMIDHNIHGNILNICSSSSLRPAIQPYTLSKWGMRGLTLGMAKALCKHGIVVNGIAPGPTISGFTSQTEDDIYKEDSPIGRWALPSEIANMAVMLVSNACRTIVGDIIYMTGGAGIITFEDMTYEL